MRAALVLIFSFTLSAEVRRYPAQHFEVTIPDGWQEISKDELLQLAKNLRESAPEADAQAYDYGFRPPGASEHVRVAIQVKYERWSEDFFDQTSKLPRAKGLIQHGVTASSPFLAELQPKIGEMRWDPDKQLLWIRTEIPEPKLGGIQVLSGARLTEQGSIQIHASAPGKDYDKLSPEFAGVIESVKIDDGYEYVRRSNLRLFFAENGWIVLAMVGFASMVGAAALWRKKAAK